MVMSARIAGKADLKRQDDPHLAVGAAPMSDGCKSYAVDLSAYFDGELEGVDAERIRVHLETCAACQDTLLRLRKLRSALHALSKPPRQQRSILAALKTRMEEMGEDEPSGEDAPPC